MKTSTIKTISGFHAGPLPMLRHSLKKWVEAQEQCAKEWEWKDAPWWYNERASISTLAGAVWSAGGIAFEEFSTHKTLRQLRKNAARTHGHGRCDLYIYSGGYHFMIEAKFCWVTPRGKAKSILNESMKAATKDAKLNTDDGLKVAAVFAALRIPKSKKDESEESIQNFIKLLEGFGRCAIAWVFPNRARFLSLRTSRSYYPGAAVILRPLRTPSLHK